MAISDQITVLCLHENLHLMEQTACLLNSEWPRSLTARLRSLECSRIQAQLGFPVSLLLVTNHNGIEEVIGHSKTMLIYNQVGACYIESVVINKMMRGKGYGRLIMEKTEDHAKRRGITCIYLTTQNEEEFYSKLGYQICGPITFCGSGSAAIQEKFKNLGICPTIQDEVPSETQIDCQNSKSDPQETINRNSNPATPKSTDLPLAPPPPKLPVTLVSPLPKIQKVYMKKEL